MTLLNIELTTPAADGSLTPAKGVIRFTPTARRVVDDITVLRSSFQVPLVLGLAAVELEPTTLAWVWQIDEHISGSRTRTIYATIPDALEVNYTDLIPIDPDTLEPAPSTDPAWLAALTELSAATITPDPDDPGFFLIGA